MYSEFDGGDRLRQRFCAAHGGSQHGKSPVMSDYALCQQDLADWCAAGQGRKRVALFGPIVPIKGFESVALTTTDSHIAASLHASEILAGAVSPWIELRRDQLAPSSRLSVYRSPLRGAVAAVALLLVSVCFASLWHGRQYQALAHGYAAQQVDIYKSALPGQRVPGSVLGRVASERKKLAGLGGETLDAPAPGKRSSSALDQLRTVLSSIPVEGRFRILELSVAPELVRIGGQARSHADAERLSVALRETGSYEVDPPKTQAIDDGARA